MATVAKMGMARPKTEGSRLALIIVVFIPIDQFFRIYFWHGC